MKSWKRPKDSFGFAEFSSPEGALRATKIINGLRMKEKKIKVTADEKCKKLLEEYEVGLIQKRIALEGPTTDAELAMPVEEILRKRDEFALKQIQELIEKAGLQPTTTSKSASRSNSAQKREGSSRRHGRSRSRSRRRRRRRSRSSGKDRSRGDRKRRKKEETSSRPKSQKELVALIPRDPKETLEYEVDWSLVQQSDLVEQKMRSWIDARLTEYLGGQEDVELTNFVVGLLSKHSPPKKIKNEMQMVLVEDAEDFVVKMWRRLIFETLKVKYDLA